MLNAYSPEQWNAIGVLVVIVIFMYLTDLYFKICEDNRRSRSRDEPDAQEYTDWRNRRCLDSLRWTHRWRHSPRSPIL
ncbi:phage holin [Klebsiella aerogenes]|uniref:phage holin n=1 Tax=Klebsiella aerogenes TaxID=548 RepID=UPI004044FDC9